MPTPRNTARTTTYDVVANHLESSSTASPTACHLALFRRSCSVRKSSASRAVTEGASLLRDGEVLYDLDTSVPRLKLGAGSAGFPPAGPRRAATQVYSSGVRVSQTQKWKYVTTTLSSTQKVVYSMENMLNDCNQVTSDAAGRLEAITRSAAMAASIEVIASPSRSPDWGGIQKQAKPMMLRRICESK